MKIQVKVKTGAKVNRVSFDEENNLYTVLVRARPIKGRANDAAIKALAEYLDVPKSQISLKIGQRSRVKVFEIID